MARYRFLPGLRLAKVSPFPQQKVGHVSVGKRKRRGFQSFEACRAKILVPFFESLVIKALPKKAVF